MFKFVNVSLLSFMILICSLAIQPANYIFQQVEIDKPSDKDIFAPKSITFVDEKATEQLVNEALLQVQDVYEHDKNVYVKIEEDMNLFLTSLATKRELIQKTIKAESLKPIKDRTLNINEFTSKEIASMNNPFNFTENQLRSFISVEQISLNKYTDQLLKELKTLIYIQGVNDEKLESTKSEFIEKSEDLLFYTTGQVDKVSPFLVSNLAERIVVNFSLNEEATKLKKEETLEKVEPVYKQVIKGELIVGQGVKVTEDIYLKLKELGLLEKEFQYKEFFFQIPYVALFLFILHFYCFKYYEKYFNEFKNYLFLLLSIFILISSSNIIDDLRIFLGILTMFLLISVIIWGRKFIISFSIILGFLIYSGEFVYVATTIITGFIIALLYKPDGERIELIKTGLYIGLTFVITQFIFKLTVDNELTSLSVELTYNFWFLVSTSVAAAITIGAIPVVEKFLGIVTYFRLHEFNKHSHPLIKKLIMDAPGTYDHSIKVGNLAELAADAIGANGLLVRVGAYYHDIGKTKNPEYFIENTTPGTNPHDYLDPFESARIITSHPLDGAKLCREHKMPEPIVRMVLTHHSDSTLNHIHSKALIDDPEADINKFKYNCPTPVSKEEGILMLADSTEAYSRVLLEQNLSKEELEKSIRKSIYTKVSNGDLRDCELTFEELEVIITTFVNYLSKSNHKRIVYNTNKN